MRNILWVLFLSLSFAFHVEANIEAPELDDSIQPLLLELTQVKLKQTAPLLEKLEQAGGDTMLPLFELMLSGSLYYQRSDRALVGIKKQPEGQLIASDVFTGAGLGEVDKKSVKKIRVNNKLRKHLREAIARVKLNASDDDQRLAAVKTIMSDLSDATVAVLEKRLEIEKNEDVATALKQAIALYSLQTSKTASAKKLAIETLATSLDPLVRNELGKVLEKNEQGEFLEADVSVRSAASKALKDIDSKVEFYEFIEQLFFGLSLGSVLLLAAIGLAITFGVMGVINMAHGEMIMLGAYTTYVVQLLMPNYIDYSLWLAIPAAFIVSGLVGIAIERGVIRYLHGRPLETLLATFGISLVLQQAVRSIFSPLNRQVSTPEWMSGSLEINSVLSFTYNRLYILVFALIVFFALLAVLKKTSLGLNVRAVSQNRDMAKAMGIKTEWVDAMTFGLGSGIAGVAGVALSQLTNVGPNLGQSYIIDSFMVVVFGGVGNLWGTLVAGFTLGVTNKFAEPIIGAVLANILILVFIILFIQKRPKGLFPQRGRAAND